MQKASPGKPRLKLCGLSDSQGWPQTVPSAPLPGGEKFGGRFCTCSGSARGTSLQDQHPPAAGHIEVEEPCRENGSEAPGPDHDVVEGNGVGILLRIGAVECLSDGVAAVSAEEIESETGVLRYIRGHDGPPDDSKMTTYQS